MDAAKRAVRDVWDRRYLVTTPENDVSVLLNMYAEAAITAYLSATGWRTIDSVPKDGSYILLHIPNASESGLDVVIGHWSAAALPADDPAHADDGWYEYAQDGGFPIDVPVTHWMPRPDAP